jgi:outer membrane protein
MMARDFVRFLRSLALVLVAVGLVAPAAIAETKIATVDFQLALNQVKEAATTKARLEGMFSEKRKNIERMQKQLMSMQQEIESQQAILSEKALAEKTGQYQTLAMQYQQSYVQSEQEMQAQYMQEMDKLIEKMRTVVGQIAEEKKFHLVIEVSEGGAIYSKGVADLTAELVTRYDKAYSG